LGFTHFFKHYLDLQKEKEKKFLNQFVIVIVTIGGSGGS